MTSTVSGRLCKRDATREFAGGINDIKSELIYVLSDIEAEGLKKSADELSRIIGRLEAWQLRWSR